MNTKDFDWDRPNPFIHSLVVGHEAIDSYQHVNNAVYLRWLDDCARAHSLHLGVDCDQATEFGLGMAVRESRATYLAAAFKDQELLIGTWIINNDLKLRMMREFQIIRADDGLVLLRAAIHYVCINIKTGKPAKMPVEFKQRYLCYDTE